MVPDSPWAVVSVESRRADQNRIFDDSQWPTNDEVASGRARQLASLLLRCTHRLDRSKASTWPTGTALDRNEWTGGSLDSLDKVRSWVNRLWMADKGNQYKWYVINIIESFAATGSAPGVKSAARYALRSIASFSPDNASKISLEQMERAIDARRTPRGKGGFWKPVVELLGSAGLISEQEVSDFAAEGEPTRSSLAAGYRRWKRKRKGPR